MDFATSILTDKTRPSLWLVKMNWTQDEETMYLELLIGAKDKQSVKDIAINYAKSNIRKTNPSDIHLTYTSFGRLQDSRTYYKSPLMHKINTSGRKSELQVIENKNETEGNIPSYEILMLAGLLAKYYPDNIYNKNWYLSEVKKIYTTWLESKQKEPNYNFQDYINDIEEAYASFVEQQTDTDDINHPKNEITKESLSNLQELQTVTQSLKQDITEILSNETIIKNLIKDMTQQTKKSVQTMNDVNTFYEDIITKIEIPDDEILEQTYEENITLKPEETLDSKPNESNETEYEFWNKIATNETKDFLTQTILNECHMNNIMYVDNNPDFQQKEHTFIELLQIIMTTGIDFKKKETINKIESLISQCVQAYKKYHKDSQNGYSNNDIIQWLTALDANINHN